MASDSSVALCRPLPYGLRVAPSKEDGGALEGKRDDYSTPTQDYAVTSGQRDRSPPSPSVLCGHPRRPNTIPGTASPSPTLWGDGATRRRHTGCCAPCGLPSAASSSQCTDDDQTRSLYAAASKPFLDGYRARHDASPEAGIARTAVYSTALYAIPRHVDKTVWHACKLPPPWPIKGEAVPRPQGDDRGHSLARFLPSPRYWHLPQSVPLGPGGSASSPVSLVAPSASTAVQRNIVPRAHPCWTYGSGRNQDKTQCHKLLSTGHRDIDLSASTS
jgi:hypothetical protein